MRLLIMLLWLLPAAARAQDAPSEEPTTEAVAPDPRPVDAFTARLQELVERYYQGVARTPSGDERDAALDSIREMLLAGVALPRVVAAVDEAVRLNTPGRAVPFHIAVPLRVRPANPAPPLTAPRVEAPPSPAQALDPELEARRAAQRARATARRTRVRLYNQWRSRTRGKRTLLMVGIPLWSIGYGVGFGTGGLTVLAGQATHEQAWLRAIPLVGQFIYYGVLNAEGFLAPDAIAFGLMEVSGAALIVTSLLLKADWPYDRDPTALRILHPDGRVALRAMPVLSPTFAGVMGRF